VVLLSACLHPGACLPALVRASPGRGWRLWPVNAMRQREARRFLI
jgi:hypothetical protein